MSKLRVAVIFGGRSGEHEVSIVSARAVMKNLDRHRYQILPYKISKIGRWNRKLKKSDVDVAFPLVHGTFGEDGCLQGYLEILDIPYVGCGVLASAIGMDKVIQKRLFREARLPIAQYESFTAAEWRRGKANIVRRIEKTLGYPLFVKPSSLGSSVGISRVGDRPRLTAGINTAFRYDGKVLVEKAIPHAREIEVAVWGNENPQVSPPGEIISSNEFYDYNAKYVDGASKSLIPAKLTLSQSATIRKMAVRAFTAIDGRGMARVDFLVSGRGRIVVNEINTIPGFTEISMFPKLAAASGLPFRRLLDKLISLALSRRRLTKKLNRSYHPKKNWWR